MYVVNEQRRWLSISHHNAPGLTHGGELIGYPLASRYAQKMQKAEGSSAAGKADSPPLAASDPFQNS